MRTGGDEYRPQKPWSELVSWAREELNLRPLLCQIQRASTGLHVGRLRIGKDHPKAAGECRCERPGALIIRHGSHMVVLIPTAASCCPSAARRTELDIRVAMSPYPNHSDGGDRGRYGAGLPDGDRELKLVPPAGSGDLGRPEPESAQSQRAGGGVGAAHPASVGSDGQQRVLAKLVGVAVRSAAFVLAVDLRAVESHVDRYRRIAWAGTGLHALATMTSSSVLSRTGISWKYSFGQLVHAS
jgi:hypothetical protein